MKYLTFILLLTSIGHANWFCTDTDSIQKNPKLYWTCGVGENDKESLARKEARENSISNFKSFCEESYNCKGLLHNFKPLRTECSEKDSNWKCFAGFEVEILDPVFKRVKNVKVSKSRSNKALTFSLGVSGSTVKAKRTALSELGLSFEKRIFSFSGVKIRTTFLSSGKSSSSYSESGYKSEKNASGFTASLGFPIYFYRAWISSLLGVSSMQYKTEKSIQTFWGGETGYSNSFDRNWGWSIYGGIRKFSDFNKLKGSVNPYAGLGLKYLF